jgi:hypothetical protein
MRASGRQPIKGGIEMATQLPNLVRVGPNLVWLWGLGFERGPVLRSRRR